MGEMHPVCQRLPELRERAYGPRGRSAFARDLGLAPSTYAHFEQGRLPGADVLHKAARLTRVSLEWLLTGEDSSPAAESPGDSDVGRRISSLLARHPDLEPSIARMLDSLEEAAGTAAKPTGRQVRSVRQADRDGWIPVIGSTAAGTARFWAELPGPHPGEDAEARLETLIAEAGRADIHSPGRIDSHAAGGGESAPMLVQCSHPDQLGLLEFVAAPQLKQRYPRAVAWRIDGDSMEPRYRDADLVIVATELPALEGQPCVARQRGQIGVNCKLLRREGNDVLLIPINERYPVQRFPASQLEWALRIVGMLRLHA